MITIGFDCDQGINVIQKQERFKSCIEYVFAPTKIHESDTFVIGIYIPINR